MASFEVVVCGGGIAGAEGLLRLRRLAGDRIGLTLLSPDEALRYRPLAVRDPFSGPGAHEYPIERIAADTGARWVKDRVASVEADGRVAHTLEGHELPYDALLLAIGAREEPPYAHAHAFTGRNADETLRPIVHDLDAGRVRSVAFVLPHEWMWPLPLYELALLSAEHARSMNVEPRLTFVTAEGRPLKAFGQAAGEAITRLLREAGIELHTGVAASVPAAGVVKLNETRLKADRIVTLPRITGPALKGVPAGRAGSSRSTSAASCRASTDVSSPPATPLISRSSTVASAPSRPTPPRRASCTWQGWASARRRSSR